jgi:hypothetical protein
VESFIGVSCEYRNERQGFLKSGNFCFTLGSSRSLRKNYPLRYMLQDLTIRIRDVTLAFPQAHLFSLIGRCFYKDVPLNYCSVCYWFQHCISFRLRPSCLCELCWGIVKEVNLQGYAELNIKYSKSWFSQNTTNLFSNYKHCYYTGCPKKIEPFC